jgi:1,5-anhydro-D-fructose reductase (1,5-anhydro-D-mannitol-forming)
MDTVRWGIIGCGDVTEVKSGPGFQKADGSALVAVMRRDRAKADDFARRHGVPRVHDTSAGLIADPTVDAVYVATTPSSHHELALQVAAAGKPCLVEKPMAVAHAQCLQILDAFRQAGQPLWVAYYRRALPRFLKVRELLRAGAIGRVTSVHVDVRESLATPERAASWRLNPSLSGGGLLLDLGSHCVDLDFLLGPITAVHGYSVNTGSAYESEDVTTAAFDFGTTAGTAVWNFNAGSSMDRISFTGSSGELITPIFTDGDVIVDTGSRTAHRFRNPPHVHQPLIQTIVDELRGYGQCESTGESGARASWVLDKCLGRF